MIRNAACALFLLCSYGCAAPQSQPQKQWYNPAFDNNQAAQSGFVIDRGECQTLAINSVPYVPPPSPRSSPNYNNGLTTSQIQLNSSSGQTYYGQITTGQIGYNDMGGGFAGGWREGERYNAAMAQYQQAEQAKTNLFFSCMYRRGWELR
jgi:hypothetical protein